MSTLSYAVRDSTTMLRRDFRHSLRYPMMTVTAVALPVFYLLLFVACSATRSAPAWAPRPPPAATTSITSRRAFS